ncbi:hypothetical protein [Williamsia sp. 1135]|uniref:hypothetical protein n=1 Tax=Williamsia sp. 1135 TaxID=1889262 RepID=UPI000A0FC8BE|nr:hypothetical protein [Williamsia sp. 1135]ORM37589.1 hypothetical protein BFL43_03640 [Williamsia sp. 1135]
MRNDVVLGISIDAGEILSVLIKGASGELLAQNRIPISPQSDLIATIDRLIRSAPETITSVGIACADPATQIMLSEARRKAASSAEDDEDEYAVPPWLLAASITAVSTALAVIAARQFAGMGKILVVNVDSAGHTAAVQPMVLVDPVTESVVDTASLPPGTPPVQEMAGARAVSDAMTKLPGRGRDVEMITPAGAGAEIPDLASTLGAATGLGVQPIEHGEYAVAHGAAALTKPNKAVLVAAAGPGKKKSMVAAGVAALAVSAALIGGGAYLIKNGGSESPRKADVVAPFSTSVSPTTTKTSSVPPKPTSPSRAPSSTTSVTSTTLEVPETTAAVETMVVETTTTRRPAPKPRMPSGDSERPPAPDLPDYTPPSRPSSQPQNPPPSPTVDPPTEPEPPA